MEPTQDEPEERGGAPARVARRGLFRDLPHGTLAAIAMTAAAIGLGSLGLELLMTSIVEQEPIGYMIGLPVPFISTPLGLGAIIATAPLLQTKPRAAIAPLVSCLIYWGAVAALWP